MDQDSSTPSSSFDPVPLSREAQIQNIVAHPEAFLDAYSAEMEHLRASIRTFSQSQAPPVNSSQPPPALDPQTIATIVAAVTASLPHPPEARSSRSEKLPDIDKYNGEVDKLDAWEQALIQRMNGNADRYPTERSKIVYAESRLAIAEKAHNLMNRYRVDGLCVLTSFEDWCRKLRQTCGNRFEEEDARLYLRDTLKQGSMSFDEYYNLFVQKKNRSNMEEASLIDAMKTNVNYATQAAAIAWRKPDGSLPSSFQDHVDMWSTVDWHLRQIKHRHPRATNVAASSTPTRRTPNATSNPTSKPTASSSTPSAGLSVSVVPVPGPASDPMDLSQAMAAVKGKSLKIPGVKDICNTWNLCYYCKLQHPGKTAINCPSKDKKPDANARAMVLYEQPSPDTSADAENI